MRGHFRRRRDGRITFDLSTEEKAFLGDVLGLLATVGIDAEDPAARRLRVPVYLDDPDADAEWWRFMGEELTAARDGDRAVYRQVTTSEGRVILSDAEADGFLRVLNEGRLALGARFGVEVEEDHDRISDEQRQVLDFLGWILEELTMTLSAGLSPEP